MSALAVAAGTDVAAEIGARIARAGGNAVDAAIAATFASWVCEPGLTALGSGGFCCVSARGDEPIMIDGFAEMPGRGAPPELFGQGRRAQMDYGGGTETIVGCGSIATPGALAALERAWRGWGRLPWSDLIAPAVALARDGFPLPRASATYFASSGDVIYVETDDARRLHTAPDGRKHAEGETVAISDLAASLEMIAAGGAGVFYEGALARRIGDWIRAHGGLLGAADLAAYEAVERPCLEIEHAGWSLATNPAPAVGGLILVELIALMDDQPAGAWSADDVARFARAMQLAFTDRTTLLGGTALFGDGRPWLDRTVPARRRELSSPATSHSSAVDRDGLACAITTSTGYGSGVMVPGTGIMFNNMLGEIELAPNGYHGDEPGARLRSNMAPSVMRSAHGDVVSFGAAGADRITSALAQVWLNRVNLELGPEAAVRASRCHYEIRDGEPTLAFEPGIDVSKVPFAVRAFDERHMYFGGVQATALDPDGTLHAIGDERRAGGSRVVEA